MMAFFIELGMDTGNVDMAKTMAEVFQRGDANKDDKLNQKEFVNVSKSRSSSIELQHSKFCQGMMSHPVTAKIMSVKTIDGLLETF